MKKILIFIFACFIVTFLAVLDLTRQHILFFTVDEKDNIWFSKGNLSA